MAEYIAKNLAIELMHQSSYLSDGDLLEVNGNLAKARIEEEPAADVIRKADMITLLEETEKDITKGVETSSTGMMIKAVFGVIKCKVNMWKEIPSTPYQEDKA